ncbi:MAG: DUF3320 domain-containing protein [Archangium sp.]
MATSLSAALQQWRSKYPGEETQWKRLEGWLLDHAPNERKAIKALAAVARRELFRHLEPLAGKKLDPFTFRRLVDGLIAEEALSAELAESAIILWSEALGVIPPDAASLRGPVDKSVVAVSLDGVRCLHLAMINSDVKLVSQVRVESLVARPLADLSVSVWLSGVEVGSTLRSTTWTGAVERLKAKQVALIDGVMPVLAPQPLHELRASATGRWWIEVKQKDEVLLRSFVDVEVAPPRTWVQGRAPVSTLAAFVVPNDPLIAELVAEASQKVVEGDVRPAPLRAFEALRSLLGELDLSLERATPDTIASPRAMVNAARASWLELQLLMAACLEHAGLSPLLIWASSGPALGLWTAVDRPALTDTDDPVALQRLTEAGTLQLVPVGDHVVRLSDETSATFLALDLASARRAGVLSLPSAVLDDGRQTKTGHELRERLLERAALTGNRSGLLLPGAWSSKLSRHAAELGTNDPAAPRLANWKRRLLDLTLNNPLLNLRSRVTSLPLLLADLPAVEDALSSGQKFGLLARPNPATSGPVTPELMRASVTSGSLLVDLPEGRVAIQAKNALRAHREALDEGGVHTLFLSLGMLEWFDPATPTVPRLAPLLLMPVLLRRSRLGHYETKKADGEAEFNAALLEMLRREYGVDVPGLVPLPSDATGVDVKEVFDVVRRALAKNAATASWTVKEQAQIAPIAFASFRMWRDLDHQASDLLRHPLVRRLAAGGDTGVQFERLDPATLDAKWAPRDVLCPLDADGSQLAAVLSAASGQSFVLEGPPGTGKSQTIANLIAQCMASGKSVLFVAQKRAALEVVQHRLDAVGLGPFLLELHSKKASKQEFIAQLKAAADFRARKPARDWTTEADALAKARGELNDVVSALHTRHEPGQTVFETIAELERVRGLPRLDEGFESADAFSAQWSSDAKAALGDLPPAFARLTPGWKELENVRATEWPTPKRTQLEGLLDALVDKSEALRKACGAVSEWMPGLESASIDSLELAERVLDDVQHTPRPRAELLAGAEDEVEAWLVEVEKARAQVKALAPTWTPALLAQPLDDWHGRLKQWMSVFFLGWLVLAFTVRWAAKKVTRTAVPPTPLLVAEVEQATQLRKARTGLGQQTPRLVSLLGALSVDEWELPQVDVEKTRALLSWSRTFRSRTSRFPKAMALAVHGGPDVSEAVVAFRNAYKEYRASVNAVTNLLELSGAWTKPAEAEHLSFSSSRAKRIREQVGQLREWGAYRRNREACVALGLTRAVKALERGDFDGRELVDRFTRGWQAWWLQQRVAQSRALASFDGLKLDGQEQRYADADRALRDLAREEVRSRLAARLPRLDEGAPPQSQAGILLRQFNRKAGLASPRQLFSECAGTIRALKPCVLMSPQSVAQYLDPSQPPFDVVVFDEASQVPTHEAIGAIARGRQVVVVGDSRQLPPTSFFLGQSKEEDSEDDEVFTELDSILEECSASGLPSLQLSWHYRSKHPSLIAFSNARYYSDRLQLFPAAHARSSSIGVSRVLVKGTYDRGHTATNRAEAEALVTELVRRLKDPREQRRSLAVVTFSRAQQGLIEDLLEEAREKDPELEPFFDPELDEPLIVKNLENIQGDERDVVLFSIGYGPDKFGKMTANLGPLGQLGGERRLNVAVTRAREQLMIFVSFEPQQLDLSGSSAKGLHDLKAFLDAAANGGDVVMGKPADELAAADTVLKNALRAKLQDAGFTVDLDVGIGRYRLDLAVRHPEANERYVMGLELDGVRLSSTETARDRDRLRREVLSQLGWKHIARVRALDWHESTERVVSELVKRIRDAAAEPIEVAPLPPLPTPAVKSAPAEEAEQALPPEPEPEPEPAGSNEDIYQVTALTPATTAFSWNSKDVIAAVEKIIGLEGPVSERIIGRRLAEAWALKRAPSSLSTNLAAVVKLIAVSNRPVLRDGFLWPQALHPDTWRHYRVSDPNKTEDRREGEDIALEELANCADAMLTRYGQMPREDLARALAKRFGFRGLTPRVAARMEEGIVFAERRRAPATT